ncbi:MAG TPA: GtrA family protein [Burkholderiales bacterium]|nr:GtrA family protein [Burkholderiales bacterium]
MVLGRYFTVGVTCALLHNAIMIGGDWLGLHYVASCFLSFAIVVVVGYRLHSGWTFRAAERSAPSFARYLLVASANLPMALAGFFLLVDLFGLPVPIASPLLTLALLAVNFVGNRWALRARPQSTRHT